MHKQFPTKPASLAILGTRGIPARHGGFETFAEKLATFLVGNGWEVDVYCQTDRQEEPYFWNGVRLVPLRAPGDSALSTLVFDLLATLHSLKNDRLPLVLGYNTAALSIFYRLTGRRSVMNMDGTEWQRDRWPKYAKAWFWLNERLGCYLSDHLIADHPEIARRLATKVRASKISFIAYGSDPTLAADPMLLAPLVPGQYGLVIGRIVPENSILEIVRGWTRAGFNQRLAVVGAFNPKDYAYHAAVKEAAGESVHFLGPVYNKARLDALRLYALVHIHGHRVGGTNPSLVEALGAGSPIIAHDNCFNRWVAGKQAFYFKDDSEFILACRKLLTSPAERLAELRRASRARHAESFQWDGILAGYERVLLANMVPELLPKRRPLKQAKLWRKLTGISS
jgi:glycosyltransferase involved in cell wall biosynthesis